MKFSIIYSDPPWQYRVYAKKDKGRTAESHYPTMDKDDIRTLEVGKIANKDCILFLWVTFPCLREGLEVIESWGFTYRTCGFTWVKKNRKSDSFFTGMGFWTRANAEICLIATKGHPRRVSKSVPQICDAPVSSHSRKPDEIRERIVALCGDLPRVELFAREEHDGWVCIGNEIDGRDIRVALRELDAGEEAIYGDEGCEKAGGVEADEGKDQGIAGQADDS